MELDNSLFTLVEDLNGKVAACSFVRGAETYYLFKGFSDEDVAVAFEHFLYNFNYLTVMTTEGSGYLLTDYLRSVKVNDTLIDTGPAEKWPVETIANNWEFLLGEEPGMTTVTRLGNMLQQSWVSDLFSDSEKAYGASLFVRSQLPQKRARLKDLAEEILRNAVHEFLERLIDSETLEHLFCPHKGIYVKLGPKGKTTWIEGEKPSAPKFGFELDDSLGFVTDGVFEA